VKNYGEYKYLKPEKFSNARVVGKEGGKTDVYLQVNVLRGLVSLWQVLRFGPVQTLGPGGGTLGGNFFRGNVEDAPVIFTMKRVDDNFTLLKMDLLIAPTLPAPQSAIE